MIIKSIKPRRIRLFQVTSLELECNVVSFKGVRDEVVIETKDEQEALKIFEEATQWIGTTKIFETFCGYKL